MAGLNIPTQEIIDEFLTTVKTIEQTLLPNEYIGVHCTHGKNRTGYMIVNYMCREKGVKLKQAINAFEKSREPHKIDKEYLLTDLK